MTRNGPLFKAYPAEIRSRALAATTVRHRSSGRFEVRVHGVFVPDAAPVASLEASDLDYTFGRGVPRPNKTRVITNMWSRRLTVSSAYLVFLFLVLEISVRYFVPIHWLTTHYRGNSSNVWRLAWASNKQTGASDPREPFLMYHSGRGWTLKPGLRDLTVFETMKELNSNSQGLRGLTEYELEKPKLATRIAVIGDSFTFGEEVNDSDTYSSLLDKALKNVEVINFGIGGYGHDQILLYFEETVSTYRPDIVVLGFVRDDMRRNMLSFRDYAKPRFVLDGNSDLQLKNVPVPKPAAVLKKEKYQSRLIDIVTILYHELLLRKGLDQSKMEALTSAILDRLLAGIRKIDAEPVFVYLPHTNEILLNYQRLQFNEERFFTAYCEDRKIRCINLRRSFLATHWSGTLIHSTGHWRENGHRVVAEELGSYLLQQGLVAGARFTQGPGQ